MEQLSFKVNECSDAEIIQEAIEKEIKKPEYIRHLFVETNKDETISIKAKSYLAARIKLTKKTKYILVRKDKACYFHDYLLSFESQSGENKDQIEVKDNEWIRIPIKSLEDVICLVEPLSTVYMLVLSELGGESFGCCARFLQCSDEKKCINPDFIMSLACLYKRNLEAGRIFYGKNKNC